MFSSPLLQQVYVFGPGACSGSRHGRENRTSCFQRVANRRAQSTLTCGRPGVKESDEIPDPGDNFSGSRTCRNRSEQATGAGSDSNDSIFKSYEFPSHPNLTHLCQQRVYGSGREITWDAFASAAKPAELVKYYRQKIGNAGFTRGREGGTWRLPAGAPHPDRVLDIMSVGTPNPARDCQKSPPSDSRSIIMLSRMN